MLPSILSMNNITRMVLIHTFPLGFQAPCEEKKWTPKTYQQTFYFSRYDWKAMI